MAMKKILALLASLVWLTIDVYADEAEHQNLRGLQDSCPCFKSQSYGNIAARVNNNELSGTCSHPNGSARQMTLFFRGEPNGAAHSWSRLADQAVCTSPKGTIEGLSDAAVRNCQAVMDAFCAVIDPPKRFDCSVVDACNPGSFVTSNSARHGHRWTCVNYPWIPTGSRCPTRWEPCLQGANPREFNGDWWVCPPNRSVPTGNSCAGGTWVRYDSWKRSCN